MNFRRGFFRLWLVFSILFVIGTAAVFYRDVRSEFEKAAVIANSILMVPVACNDARGKAGIDYEVFDDPSKTNKCWYQVPKLRALFPEYKDLADDQLSDRLYQKAGIQTTPVSPWSLVTRAASIAIGVPLIVLAVGSALGWSLAGFSGARLK
jgi:hypothetical protein